MPNRLMRALERRLVDDEIEAMIERVPKPLGSYGFDAWGFDESKVRVTAAVVRQLYRNYFRVEAHGLENIPPTGRVLVVGNHSGQLPIDGLLVAYALLSNPAAPRAPRAMIERFIPSVPWLGNLLNGMGAVIGDPYNCARLLEAEEAIIVFPEGARGSGKPWRDRYQLQRFGDGFMHLAMAHCTPVVPVGVVGCEETMPSLGNIRPLARLLGLPYVPMTTPIPLPARVSLHFGKPLRFDSSPSSEASVLERVDHVRDVIADLVEAGLVTRRGVFR